MQKRVTNKAVTQQSKVEMRKFLICFSILMNLEVNTKSVDCESKMAPAVLGAEAPHSRPGEGRGCSHGGENINVRYWVPIFHRSDPDWRDYDGDGGKKGSSR